MNHSYVEHFHHPSDGRPTYWAVFDDNEVKGTKFTVRLVAARYAEVGGDTLQADDTLGFSAGGSFRRKVSTTLRG